MGAALYHMNYETGEIEGSAAIGICCGNRTGGKTVGHAARILHRYAAHGERAILLARTDKQKSSNYLERWWQKSLRVDDSEGYLKHYAEMHKIAFTQDVMTVDGEPCCYCAAISMSAELKDMGTFDHVTTILLDEAVQSGERVLYSRGRPAMQRIFEIWQTVARGWTNAEKLVNIVFISNISERDNWIFNDLRVNDFARRDTKFTVQHNICLEIFENKTAAAKVSAAGMAECMLRSKSGAKYFAAANANRYQDNDSFVVPRGLDFSKIFVQLAVRGQRLGVFGTEERFHVATIDPDDRAPVIAARMQEHTEETKMDESYRYTGPLLRAYRVGQMTFQTQESKNMFLEFFGYM